MDWETVTAAGSPWLCNSYLVLACSDSLMVQEYNVLCLWIQRTFKHVLHLIRPRNAFFFFSFHIHELLIPMKFSGKWLFFLISYVNIGRYSHAKYFIKQTWYQAAENLLGLKAWVEGETGLGGACSAAPQCKFSVILLGSWLVPWPRSTVGGGQAAPPQIVVAPHKREL